MTHIVQTNRTRECVLSILTEEYVEFTEDEQLNSNFLCEILWQKTCKHLDLQNKFWTWGGIYFCLSH